MRLEHHLVGGYVRYISPHIIIIIMYVFFLSAVITGHRRADDPGLRSLLQAGQAGVGTAEEIRTAAI